MPNDLDLRISRDLEREPHIRQRHARNGTEYNESARERLALKFALVGTEEEAREARGLPPLSVETVNVAGAWSPAQHARVP